MTDRCNFRCGYCMPKDVFGKNHQFLPPSQLLSYDSIVSLVKAFTELGVTKVRLTGGEPLLRKDLERLVEKIANLEEISDVAITTNASLLTRKRAVSLKTAGIQRVNISFDAITPQIYRQINQIAYPMEDILAGIDNAIAVGFETVKVNMVVQKGINETDIIPMVEHFRGSGVILRFIEFMDVGNHNQWNYDRVFTSQQIIDEIQKKYPLKVIGENYPGEVAKRWEYLDGKGEVGVISSITQPFCGGCTRARLSAIGELFTCLFAHRGFDLRKMLDDGLDQTQIVEKLTGIWMNRKDQYSVDRLKNPGSMKLPPNSQKVEMSYIGG